MTTQEIEPTTQRVVIPIEDGLELKQLFIDDAGSMKAAMDFDRDHLRQFGDDTGDKYQTEQEIIDSIIRPNDPSRLRLGIWENGIFDGSINLQPRAARVAEVGYWLSKQYAGRGIASKAVRALSKYRFEHGYTTLYAKIHPKNKASQRTVEKAGYHLARKYIDDKDQEVWVYELSKRLEAKSNHEN